MPRGRHSRKELIFETALQCFNESGYYSTSLDTIARSAGISKGGLYYHFRTKNELFIELFHYRVSKYFEQVRAYISDVRDPGLRLEMFVAKASEILTSNQDFMRFFLEFMSIGARDGDIRQVMTDYYSNSIANFSCIIQEGVATGKFLAADVQEIARAVYFISMGVFLTYFSVNADFDLVDQHVVHITNILKGLQRA